MDELQYPQRTRFHWSPIALGTFSVVGYFGLKSSLGNQKLIPLGVRRNCIVLSLVGAAMYQGLLVLERRLEIGMVGYNVLSFLEREGLQGYIPDNLGEARNFCMDYLKEHPDCNYIRGNNLWHFVISGGWTMLIIRAASLMSTSKLYSTSSLLPNSVNLLLVGMAYGYLHHWILYESSIDRENNDPGWKFFIRLFNSGKDKIPSASDFTRFMTGENLSFDKPELETMNDASARQLRLIRGIKSRMEEIDNESQENKMKLFTQRKIDELKTETEKDKL